MLCEAVLLCLYKTPEWPIARQEKGQVRLAGRENKKKEKKRDRKAREDQGTRKEGASHPGTQSVTVERESKFREARKGKVPEAKGKWDNLSYRKLARNSQAKAGYS